MANQLDHLLTHLGTGKWNLLNIIALAYSSHICVPHSLGAAFLAPKVNFTCHHSHLTDDSPLRLYNAEANATIPTFQVEQCSYSYLNTTTGLTGFEKCSDWDFDNSTFVSTVTSEFQLVCEREYLRSTYQSIYMIGVFVGAPVSGIFIDKHGRKTMLVVSSFTYMVLALGSSWLPSLSLLMLSRFLLGVFHLIVGSAGYILGVEIAEPRIRNIVGCGFFEFWALGIMGWGGLAYLLREWRVLQQVASLSGLLFLPTLWFIDESPRWLIVKGYHNRAIKILKKAARWNKVDFPSEFEVNRFITEEDQCDEKTQPGTSAHETLFQRCLNQATILVKTPRLRAITLTLNAVYMLASMVYYGLSLSGGILSDDPFVFMTLSGLMEVPSYMVIIPLVARFGRRFPAVCSFLLSGAALIVQAVIPAGYNWLGITLAMLGKVTITAAFQTVIFYSSELFPTEVRSRGLGTCFMMSRIGSIISPFIMDFVGKTYSWAPLVVFGAGSVMAGLLTLMLRETLGNNSLPDTIAQLEQATKSTSSKNWI
ncbi:organic cation transporter protein-like [Homarus americanus]|uniref:organic cation transporter protein-like n=1 Tax=Homarus americanus TaxID=6706 RepID=UPI001C46BCAC|nr:organic cation transporter protein-like [Homarus americanus]